MNHRFPNLFLLTLYSQEPEEKKIALELLETEQAYVVRLQLLDQVGWQLHFSFLISTIKMLKINYFRDYYFT